MARDSLYSAPKARSFTSFASDIDLTSAVNGRGQVCRRIRVQSRGSGALVLRLAEDAADVTFSNLQDGEVLDVQANTIVSAGTTVSAVNVFW